jgi:hypothetical protein
MSSTNKPNFSENHFSSAVCRLREHWEETRARVETRRKELNEMLAVCRRWDAARRDTTAWLDAMERRMHQLGAVAHAAHPMDGVDAQLKDQKARVLNERNPSNPPPFMGYWFSAWCAISDRYHAKRILPRV